MFKNNKLRCWHADCIKQVVSQLYRELQMNIQSTRDMHNIHFDIAAAVLAVGMVFGIVTKFFV